MKKLERGNQCLNCNKSLSKEDAFCPSCGQKNVDNNISFSQLTGDFFSNYFTLDSRFIRSILPFLFKPGVLTIRFNEGKRKAYANPVRLYIIISFIYFLIISLYVTEMAEDTEGSAPVTEQIDSLMLVASSKIDSTNSVRDSLDNLNLAEQNNKAHQSSITIESDTSWSPFTSEEWLFLLSSKASNMTTSELLDTLNIEKKSSFDQYLIKQIVRIKQSDGEFVAVFVIKNLSLMMFLMLPIFALILKLLYIRKKVLYIKHLVHTLHIHSFAFLIYTLAIAIDLWLLGDGWIQLTAFLIVTLYTFISFKRVYQQGYGKTLLKFLLTGSFYFTFLFFAFILELFLSLMLF